MQDKELDKLGLRTGSFVSTATPAESCWRRGQAVTEARAAFPPGEPVLETNARKGGHRQKLQDKGCSQWERSAERGREKSTTVTLDRPHVFVSENFFGHHPRLSLSVKRPVSAQAAAANAWPPSLMSASGWLRAMPTGSRAQGTPSQGCRLSETISQICWGGHSGLTPQAWLKHPSRLFGHVPFIFSFETKKTVFLSRSGETFRFLSNLKSTPLTSEIPCSHQHLFL